MCNGSKNKIFDEILVNAADNYARDPENTTRIDVTIDRGLNGSVPRITVRNDGAGVPVAVHAHENIYVPEMIFGHLLTGSNFEDERDEDKLTGGRHGYGAKLTNIFSRTFTVETCDKSRGFVYTQSWRHNMTKVEPAVITQAPADATDYTQITFEPDLARLGGGDGAGGISNDDFEMMVRRAADVAGTAAPVKVYLNGELIPLHSFADYVSLYGDAVHAVINPRWSVGVTTPPPQGPSGTGQVSFVNKMWTPRGGTHVALVQGQVVKAVLDRVQKQHKSLGISAGQVRPHVFVFVNSAIANPTFDSQAKEMLTSKPTDFGSTCVLPSAFMSRVLDETGIVERVVAAAKRREKSDLRQATKSTSLKSVIAIPKLEDALLAGGKHAAECTLILTEGDSAKALAVAGLEVVGRERYGVFPLRGKPLNVRDAAMKQVIGNAEISALCKILGLSFDKTYARKKKGELRYGHVLIMADQDHDGSHIKGLIINFFHHFWPALVNRSDFLGQFVTPLIRAGRGTKSKYFYSAEAYTEFLASLPPNEASAWRAKYYKGLGTSTSAEARSYFSDLASHVTWFKPCETHSNDLDMVFNKQRADDRRLWLSPERSKAVDGEDNCSRLGSPASPVRSGVATAAEGAAGTTKLSTFIHSELVGHAHADNVRSLPSVIDGLKPAQRKVLYGCFKRNLVDEVKVAQLAG